MFLIILTIFVGELKGEGLVSDYEKKEILDFEEEHK